MPENFDTAFAGVKQLAENFKANERFYLSPQYQEAEARRDFIDKFLILLGWDVNHDKQKNPYEQKVKVERKEHGVSQRRADYQCRAIKIEIFTKTSALCWIGKLIRSFTSFRAYPKMKLKSWKERSADGF
ncbi:MAG TPA: hypothetical protein VL981_03900 [Candidatus Methylacidiphilales bacterium]|nr:hypothetical protein [Candidatus Methylacidiphilales bacterium]